MNRLRKPSALKDTKLTQKMIRFHWTGISSGIITFVQLDLAVSVTFSPAGPVKAPPVRKPSALRPIGTCSVPKVFETISSKYASSLASRLTADS